MKKIIILLGLCIISWSSVVVMADTQMYVAVKEFYLKENPGDQEEDTEIKVNFGQVLNCIEESANGWNKISIQSDLEGERIGYIPDSSVMSETPVVACNDEKEALYESDIYDYPGIKDSEVIGELLKGEVVQRNGISGDVWSRIIFESSEGYMKTGYVPTSVFEETDPLSSEAGIISEGESDSIFSKAEEEINKEYEEGNANSVLIGNPVAVSSEIQLKPLGKFRITHYCQCRLCCGPWTNGITSTGRTAVTNHTIAVDPTQIPYGSQVVINGQVYTAEDCGGGIKTNCIDIYVASHSEALSRGLYYTEVYLIQ